MVIDFHTHILPCIDDGSSSLEESIMMLKEEAKLGVKHVVLTPHFYPSRDNPDEFLKRRQQAYELLSQELEKYPDLPKIHLGAEVYYFDGIGTWEGLKNMAIDGSRYVMIEMPMSPWSPRMYNELEVISECLGLVPIIAHVDRYIKPLKTHDIPKKLSELPVVVQANSSFFIKSLTYKYALKLVSNGLIHVIGSDCHNMTSRLPNLNLAIERIENKLGEDMVEVICDNGSHILNLK